MPVDDDADVERLLEDMGRLQAQFDALVERCLEMTGLLAQANTAIDELTRTRYPHYYSTYCIHDLHDDCRLDCKTCQEPCRCICHIGRTRGD
jgi:hypothetical protein